jgi:hypothetical protein
LKQFGGIWRPNPQVKKTLMSYSRQIGLCFVLAAAVSCSTAVVSGTFPAKPSAAAAPVHLFVMPATSAQRLSTGNQGFSFGDAQRALDEQLVAIAREKDPHAALTAAEGKPAYDYARAHGGTHLLVPTIVEWRQMRSDDPVGALVEAHNRISIELRLVQLDPEKTEGDVTFTNHARVTVNQPANRLLDDEFRKVVRKLLG